jgi:beta-lactamase regulating signal transducer with metallopeptidase domain
MIGELFAVGGDAAALPAAVVEQLARASVAGGLFAAAVWGLVRALPRLPAGWRCALWWTASLKLLLALLWVAPLELALLPAPVSPAAEPQAVELATTAAAANDLAAGPPWTPAALERAPAGSGAPASALDAGTADRSWPLPWRQALALLWLLGVAAGAAGLVRELAAVRRLRRASRPARDPDLLAVFAEFRERLGVRRRVELRLAEGIAGPLTVGLARPAVVLPAGSPRELTAPQLALALAHELLHVRRRDLWAGWVPALARRLFFFHPLAALAAREYHLAREAACDAAVLRELGAAPQAYGRLLLLWSAPGGGRTAFSGALPGARPQVGAAAAASPSYLDLKRRLVMLRNPTSLPRGLRAAAWAAALVAVAALVPLRIVAEPPVPPEPPAAPAAPAPPESPRAPELPEAPPVPAVGLVALAPEAPAVPEAPEVPKPLRSPRSHSGHSSGSFWSWSDDGDAWALLEGDSHFIDGTSEDHDRVYRLRSDSGEPLLWFRREEAEYVVRDPATLARVKEILEPQRELGRQQGELGAEQAELGRRQAELGSQQAELGRRQGELGKQQGELGAQQARLGAEQAALAAEHANLVARRAADRGDGQDLDDRARRAELEARREELSARMRELGERQRALGERQAELGRPQAELGREQAALGVPQSELGRQQAELGERQGALGERQREAAERARPLLRELFDQAVERGLAERVDRRP